MSKSFVMDDEHWITINGNHVLINGEGEVQAGMGGALKGVKLSKATSSMKGGKFKDRSKERNEAQGALEKENAKAKERLRREFIRHDKENRKNQEEADKDYDKDNEKSFGYGRAYNRLRELDPKKYGPLMKRIKERGKSLERQREQRQQGFEEKRQNLYAEHENRKSKIIKEENEKRKPLLKSVLRKDKQLDTAKEALSGARSKLKSAREANAYMKQRGTKISKFSGQSPKIKQEREKAYREQVEAENKINALTSKLENSPEYRRANNNASVGTGQTRINGVAERARLKNEAEKELAPLREQWRKAYEKQRSLANRVGGKFKQSKDRSEDIHRMDADHIDVNNYFKRKFDNLDKRTSASFNKYREDIRNGENRDVARSFHKDRIKKIDKEESKLMGQQQSENRVYNKQRSNAEKETKKFNRAKSTLEKARPKIAERREAKASYIRNQISKLAEERGAEYRKLKNATGDEEKAIINRIGKLDKKLAKLSKA